jgi:formylglycine-generating enzyme required for sulfatase activity
MSAFAAAPVKLHQEIRLARAESDRLFEALKREALYERPIAERHRVIFYVGHLDGFDWIQICRQGLGMEPFDAKFDALFQAGIDPDAAHLPTDTPADWPSLEQVTAYVRRCRDLIDENLDQAPEEIVAMAIEHRQMHLETLSYMFHNFDYSLKESAAFPRFRDQLPSGCANKWIEIPAGEAVLGKRRDDGEFGWDNEYEQHRRTVDSFSIQRYKVSNGEYLRFVQAGAPMPHFWRERGGALFYRGMFEEVPLPLDWPVYVTHRQARQYAEWLGKSLQTEEQFHRAAYGSATGEDRRFPWGNGAATHDRGNFDFKRWDPERIYATPAGDSAFGVSQLVGNGWEWTNTAFSPFPGFEPRPSYPGYSANFFDGDHYVMKGGSCRTAARLLRRSFRNWFRQDYPYMYATFRCVEN